MPNVYWYSLQVLLSQIFLDGMIAKADIDILHSALHCIFSAVIRVDGNS